MNKIFLSAAAALLAATAFSASAQDIEGFRFGYCGDEYTGIGAGTSDYWMGAAFQLTEADVEQFDGCQIVGFSIGFGTGRNKEVSLFISEDLKGEPLYTQGGARCRAEKWSDIVLKTPYTIEKGKPVYVGYKHHVQNSSAYPVGTDGNTTSATATADWVALSGTEDGLTEAWQHVGDKNGNVALRVYIKGNSLPTENCIPSSLKMPPIANPDKEFKFGLIVDNASSATMNDVEVVYQIGEDAEQTVQYTFPIPIPMNNQGQVRLIGKTSQDNLELPIRARVTKVNGKPNLMADREASAMFPCSNKFFTRKVVSEKFTGANCGYCPIGIVAFEHAIDQFSYNFIGIEVHNYASKDRMFCDYYNDWCGVYSSSGAPYLYVDRDRDLTRTAEKNALYNAILKEYNPACNYGVTADFEKVSDKAVNAIGTVEVTRDVEAADLSLTFVVTEDHVGPYYQNNNYGSVTGCPEWADKGGMVSWTYDDVARYIHNDWKGIAGSVPATLKAGEKYTYRVENMSLGNTQNFNNANIVALLIDNATGKIVNADRCRFDRSRKDPEPKYQLNYDWAEDPAITNPPFGAVDNIASSADARVWAEAGALFFEGEGNAQVFSVTGMNAGEIVSGGSLDVAPGLYVVRTAAGAVKILVK